jgi:thiamine biosynthesis lipoprotein
MSRQAAHAATADQTSAMRVAIPLALRPPRALPAAARVRCCGGQTMGTSWCARYVAPASTDTAAVRAALQACFDDVVAQMSPWRPDSSLARFNRAPPGSLVALPASFAAVLDAALAVASKTAGAFDPRCGALVDLWGFGPRAAAVLPPPLHTLSRARRHLATGAQALRRGRRHALQPGGVRLDLCAIAKGHAVDLAGQALTALGAVSWLVECGGELKARGLKPGGEPWWVALDPLGAGDAGRAPEFIVALTDVALATSGDGVKFFEHDGRRYGHVLDPRTGQPTGHGLAAVSVLHRSAMLADAYATAILVLGPQHGLRFAEAHALAARLICRDGAGQRDRLTRALDAMLA